MATPSQAGTTTITFDDSTSTAENTLISGVYQGFKWVNGYFTNSSVFNADPNIVGTGITLQPISGNYVLGLEAPTFTVSSATGAAFNLISLYLGSYVTHVPVFTFSTIGTLIGFDGAIQKYSAPITIDSSGLQLLTLNFSGITSFQLSWTRASTPPLLYTEAVALDNITVSSVPGPTAGAGSGALIALAGAAAWRSARRRKVA